MFFTLLWRTWEGSIHLFYNMGKGSELEVWGIAEREGWGPEMVISFI